MTKPQRKQYDELKKYYQVKLKKKVETEGLGKSKIHVLEALLRLRQVACDPRLVDPAAKPGAKLELLQQQLEEVVSGGSKDRPCSSDGPKGQGVRLPDDLQGFSRR